MPKHTCEICGSINLARARSTNVDRVISAVTGRYPVVCLRCHWRARRPWSAEQLRQARKEIGELAAPTELPPPRENLDENVDLSELDEIVATVPDQIEPLGSRATRSTRSRRRARRRRTRQQAQLRLALLVSAVMLLAMLAAIGSCNIAAITAP